MTTLFGMYGYPATRYQALRDIDIDVVFDATRQYVDLSVASLRTTEALFVDGQTTLIQENFVLPGSGFMERVAEGAPAGAVAVTGEWTVGYPLHHHAESILTNSIDFAYMDVGTYQANVDAMIMRYMNRRRYDIMYTLFNNTVKTFNDKRHGAISVRPLAIGSTDGVLYPPAMTAINPVPRTVDNYLVSGYTAANISTTNDPVATVESAFADTYGYISGGDTDIVVLVNSAQAAKFAGIADFVERPYNAQTRAMDTEYSTVDVALGAPGKTIGSIRGVGIHVFNHIPANYMLAINTRGPRPVKERVDPPETGLGSGALTMLEDIPSTELFYRDWQARFGFGVSNRLGAIAMEFTTDLTYDIPTAYATADPA